MKERKTFDPKPRYSTVDEEFNNGAGGLVPNDEELFKGKKGVDLVVAKAAAAKAEAAGAGDWGLTYGKKGGAKIFVTTQPGVKG